MRDSSGGSKRAGFVAFSKLEEASKAVSLSIHTCLHAQRQCKTLLES